MPEDERFVVQKADWSRDRDALGGVRRVVFIEEQGVPEELEWDDLDASSAHWLALSGSDPIGTARLTVEGQIGRMAVLAAWRHRRVGRALLEAAIQAARDKPLDTVWLNAQQGAVGFYQRFGFMVVSDAFMDAGIVHFRMERALALSTD